MTLTAASLQLVSGFDLHQNLARLETLLEQARSQGVQLVVLPENFAYFGQRGLRTVGEQEAADHGPVRQFLSAQARDKALWIVAGTLPTIESRCESRPLDGSHVYPTCFIYDDLGHEVARYDKMHLFDADVSDAQGRYRESDNYTAGNTPCVVKTPWGKLGVGICYDLRFPEYFRRLNELGADFFAVPAAFTDVTGRDHWEVLVRARALENQCYLLASNQGGVHSNSRQTWGHSMIVDGWGHILESLATGEGLVVSELDFDKQASLRQRLPALQHRRIYLQGE